MELRVGETATRLRDLLGHLEQELSAPLHDTAALLITSLQGGGRLFLCGNGGSASQAQHLAAEFVVRYQRDRQALAAVALTGDSAVLTAGGNDLGYEQVFARQVAALGQVGDVLIVLTTSGTSANVIQALREAKRQGLRTVGFLGRGGGEAVGLCDVALVVPAEETSRIQELHMVLGHLLVETVEEGLGLVGEDR